MAEFQQGSQWLGSRAKQSESCVLCETVWGSCVFRNSQRVVPFVQQSEICVLWGDSQRVVPFVQQAQLSELCTLENRQDSCPLCETVMYLCTLWNRQRVVHFVKSSFNDGLFLKSQVLVNHRLYNYNYNLFHFKMGVVQFKMGVVQFKMGIVQFKMGNIHHHHIVLAARISLTLFRHSSLSFIALGRSSGQQPVSSHSCWMYVSCWSSCFCAAVCGDP